MARSSLAPALRRMAMASLVAALALTAHRTAASSLSFQDAQLEISALGGTAVEAIREACVGRSPASERPSLVEAVQSLEVKDRSAELVREGRALASAILQAIESRDGAIRSCQVAFERWRTALAYGDPTDPADVAEEARRCHARLRGEEGAIESQARACVNLRHELIRRLAGLPSPVPFGLGSRGNLNVSDLGALLGRCKDDEDGLRCDLAPEALEERAWLGQGNLLGWATFVKRDGELRLGSLFVYRVADTCSDAAATVSQWWGRLEKLAGPTPSAAHRLQHDRLCTQIRSALQIGSHRFVTGTDELGTSGRYVAFVEITSELWDRQPVRQKFDHYD
ncbi:MAG TPA: hypothetical protein VN033_10440 [Vulgatibacter sp.]|nr:hypothetical protein [Vulgatibacter sp.]